MNEKEQALSIPTMPTIIQKTFSKVYALSFLRMEHQESITASVVLKAHTKKNGLSAPIQLTSEKLKIRMSTPTISMNLMYV